MGFFKIPEDDTPELYTFLFKEKYLPWGYFICSDECQSYKNPKYYVQGLPHIKYELKNESIQFIKNEDKVFSVIALIMLVQYVPVKLEYKNQMRIFSLDIDPFLELYNDDFFFETKFKVSTKNDWNYIKHVRLFLEDPYHETSYWVKDDCDD
jgi:hypothetical protein